MRVEHPIVLDNEYAIWSSFNNRYWPALYLVDGEGRIRYRHFGEGAYSETEDAIRELLNVDGQPTQVEATGIEAAADSDTLRSPETYVGYARGERRADAGADELALNQWTLTGQWSVEAESAVLEAAGGSLAYCFQARDLNLVLTPPDGDVGFSVLVDGRAPREAHGRDVDELGRGAVTEPRLYQLVRRPDALNPSTVEITFDDPGVRAYVFTFG
jgi:hypothetical protein